MATTTRRVRRGAQEEAREKNWSRPPSTSKHTVHFLELRKKRNRTNRRTQTEAKAGLWLHVGAIALADI
jgi:hypothetical protein